MRRPRRSPEQALQHSPEQALQQSPEQALQPSPGQAPQPSPGQALQRTTENTPDPNTHDESSTNANNDAWEVGTMHTDGRLRVEVISGVLEPSGKCSRKTSSIMYERLEPKGFTWKEVSKDAKDFYFEEFKKWVVWYQPDNLIYEAWLKSAAVRYKDLHCRARTEWEKKSELNNRIGKDVWLSWIEEWKTPKCKAKSNRKRQNRRGGVDVGDYPATHTGGSASHRTHAARMAGDLDTDLNAPTLFENLHTKNRDKITYIDKKSAAISEKLKTLRAERSQPMDGTSVPQPVDENKLYYDAVGGRNKRNRIYGLGSSEDIFYEPSILTVANLSCFQPNNNQDYQKLETELRDMKEQIKEMDQLKQRMREMETQLVRMIDSQNQ